MNKLTVKLRNNNQKICIQSAASDNSSNFLDFSEKKTNAN